MMKGLYILETTKLKKDNTLKVGMSEKLENRWKSYLGYFGDSYYLYCYETPDLNRREILYIESLVLKETKELRNFEYATEYRLIDCNLLHKIILTYLDHYKINYKIHYTPIFNCNSDPDGNEIYDYEEILNNPPETFKHIKQKNEITKPKIENTKIVYALETQGFINIEFIDDKRIIANKNDDLYIFKKRDSKTLEYSYNAFTTHTKISDHYLGIANSIKDKKYNSINYCYLVANSDNCCFVELKDINPKYTITNIANGLCDEIIIAKKEIMTQIFYR